MFSLPKLPYDYDALTKCISADTLHFHHDMHHQTYVDKFNLALEPLTGYVGLSIEEILVGCKQMPDSVRSAVCNNGGGHYNHSLLWNSMSPTGGGSPKGELSKIIVDKYGSYKQFVDEFSARALNVFGSGWVFLQPNGDIITTPNQENPIMMGLDAPVLCLDVWEHAYYLDYKNKRADYIKSWWDVVDWAAAEKRLASR